MLAHDTPVLRVALIGTGIAGFAVHYALSPEARAAVADTWLGPVGRYVKRLFALRAGTLLATLAASAALYGIGAAVERSAYPASETVRGYVAERYPGGISPLTAPATAAKLKG